LDNERRFRAREPQAGVSDRHRLLVGRALGDTIAVADDIRIRREIELQKILRDEKWKRHHKVGGGKLLTREVGRPRLAIGLIGTHSRGRGANLTPPESHSKPEIFDGRNECQNDGASKAQAALNSHFAWHKRLLLRQAAVEAAA
jgi:hypothetical protein